MLTGYYCIYFQSEATVEKMLDCVTAIMTQKCIYKDKGMTKKTEITDRPVDSPCLRQLVN